MIKTEESFKEKPAPLPEKAYGSFEGPRRKSKWDADEMPPVDATLPMPAIEERLDGPIGFKVIPLDQVQVRTLIGRGGDTIKAIRREVGSETEVIIQHQRQDETGVCRITGNVYAAEAVIKAKLQAKGCLVSRVGVKTGGMSRAISPDRVEK